MLPRTAQGPGLQESFGRLSRAGLVLCGLTCMGNPAWFCFGTGGYYVLSPGTAGSGASAQATRPKAFPFSSILIREPSASRPFAELRSRPFRACPVPTVLRFQSIISRTCRAIRGAASVVFLPSVPAAAVGLFSRGALLRSGSHTPEGRLRKAGYRVVFFQLCTTYLAPALVRKFFGRNSDTFRL